MRNRFYGSGICCVLLLFGRAAAGENPPVSVREESAKPEEKIRLLEQRKKKHERNRKIHLFAAEQAGAGTDLRLESLREYALAVQEKDRIDSIERQIRKLKEEIESRESGKM